MDLTRASALVHIVYPKGYTDMTSIELVIDAIKCAAKVLIDLPNLRHCVTTGGFAPWWHNNTIGTLSAGNEVR